MASRKTGKRSKAPKAPRGAPARSSAHATTTRPAAKPSSSGAGSKRAAPKKAAPKKAAPKKAAPKKAAPKKAVARKGAAKEAVAAAGPVRRQAAVTLPALPEVEGYVRSLPPPIVPLVNRLRRLVREAAPEAVELLDASGPAYDVNGLFARIETDGGVRVRFMRGDRLSAPEGTLSPDATVTVTTFDSLRESVLRSLVRQAVLLNAGVDRP